MSQAAPPSHSSRSTKSIDRGPHDQKPRLKENFLFLGKFLRHGTTITLVTTSPDRTVSLAGFTPAGPMSDEEIAQALNGAQRTLHRLGVVHPTAEQIQASLIGGDITAGNGRTQSLPSLVAVRGGSARVASR